MRFIILSQYYWPEVGAPQVRLEAVAAQLRARGHEVEVVTTMPSYPSGIVQPTYRRRVAVREEHDGIQVRRIWSYPAKGRGLKRLISYMSFTATSFLALLSVRSADFIVIESPPLFLTATGIIWGRIKRTNTILNVADLWPDAAVDVGAVQEGRQLRLARRLERWAYLHSTYVSSVTEGIREAVISRGVDEGRALFLPNGVDTFAFAPERSDPAVRTELGLPVGPLLAFTGTVGLAQGLENVIESVGQLGRDHVSLAIVGSGSALGEMRQLARDRSYDNVFFVDPVPRQKIAALLPGCLAGVVSLADLETNRGARPSKMFPIMASGIPVLYCGVGEGADLITAAGAGVAIANESSRVSEAIRGLLSDENTRSTMGHRGRQFAMETMSWDSLVGEWLTHLH